MAEIADHRLDRQPRDCRQLMFGLQQCPNGQIILQKTPHKVGTKMTAGPGDEDAPFHYWALIDAAMCRVIIAGIDQPSRAFFIRRRHRGWVPTESGWASP